jgi:hypothetical protein
MTISAFTNPVSGIWPLGQITVATPGTPVYLNTNVGPQTTPSGTNPTGTVRQLNFTTGANTGLIYVLRKVSGLSVTKANTNFIVAVIGPNMAVPLPDGLSNCDNINPDDYLIDADTAANKVVVCGIVG